MKALNQAGHKRGQRIGQRAAFFVNIEHVKRAFFVFLDAQPVRAVQTIGAQKPFNGLFRRINAWAFFLLFAIRQACWQSGGNQGHALRRDMAVQRIGADAETVQKFNEFAL